MFVPEVFRRIGFNQRQLTFVDFELLCLESKIIVLYLETSFQGIAFPRRGRSVIVLDRKLSGVELLIRAWHEFAHHALSHSGVRLFLPQALDKAEAEADLLSLCAVIPKVWVKEKTFNELLDEGFDWETIWQRKHYFESYKL